MKIGFLGLGRMGKNMVLHLLEEGVEVVVYNRTREKTEEFSEEGQRLGILYKAYEVKNLVEQLKPPRIIWLMVDHEALDEVLFGKSGKDTSGVARRDSPEVEESGKGLLDFLKEGDVIIDGGNSFYKDSVRRYKTLKKLGIKFLDVGVSGGQQGARKGASLMVGGDITVFNQVRPLFGALSGDGGGYAYFGPAGAGHFVKMVHNGIEYGMLEAIGEGFEILEKSSYTLDLVKVARSYSRGSVIRGWLMDLLEKALRKSPRLDDIEGVIGGGETGNWTVRTAKEFKVATPVIEKSLAARKKSLAKPTFSGKVIAALRREFGGHGVKKREVT